MIDQFAQDFLVDRLNNKNLGRVHPVGLNSLSSSGDFIDVEKRPGSELISVAASALTWWEKHRYDTTVVGDRIDFRYADEPGFVTQARRVVEKALR